MDENTLERIKARLLNGIKVNDSDFNFMKLNANLFKNIKFVKKRKAKKMADTQILDGEIIITLPVEKVYPGIKRQLEEYLNHFPIKVIPVKVIAGTKWLDTRFIKAIWRRDWIYLDRD